MPAQLYDAATLEHVATLGDALGSGHSPRAIDFEGDGEQEILVGYDAYDANGSRLWRMTQLGEVNPVKNHVDQLQIGLLPEANTPFVVYAGSDNVVLGTLSGQLLWKARFGHPQHVVLGRFGAGDDAAPIAIYCCRDLVGEAQREFLDRRGLAVPPPGNRNNIALVNHRGEVINVLFPPQLKYHSGEGILVYPQGCADGSDAIVTRDWEWPQMLDSRGNEACQLVRESPHREENRLTVGPGEDGYGVRLANFDNDAKAEILIHDQSTLWVFDPPYPAAGVPHTHDRLEPITGQGVYGLARAATQ